MKQKKTAISIEIEGVVQGVGFRPFVYNLAKKNLIKGWVINNASGVHIHAQGFEADLNQFMQSLNQDKPTHALIYRIHTNPAKLENFKDFRILTSNSTSRAQALVLPDLATCDQCQNEILDPTNRRYLYPFTNCTHCGPRYSIIEAIPYDRPNTSMKKFSMCPACKREYENPENRRFHAQPNACPVCGPQLFLTDKNGLNLAERHESLLMTLDFLQKGKIIALKGLGGFQLICDARNREAVALLRQRKKRKSKPLAIMLPSLESARKLCSLNVHEEKILQSPQAPILLAKKQSYANSKNILSNDIDEEIGYKISHEISFDSPYLGIMLPYTPLHLLLMHFFKAPIIATSANLSQEPICYENKEALNDLKDIADFFLMHNRDIVRPVDDSVVRSVNNKLQIIRRARGYVPYPVYTHNRDLKKNEYLAVGAHQKNTVSFNYGNHIIMGQHMGDLDNVKSYNHFVRNIKSLESLFEHRAEIFIRDLHQDYASSQYIENHFPERDVMSKARKKYQVQHHVAHIYSAFAEDEIKLPALGISWDGTGLGSNQDIWGGEFFLVQENEISHVKQFHPFPLLGAERTAKEPRLSAISLLFSLRDEGENKDHISDFFLNQILRKEIFSSVEIRNYEKIFQSRSDRLNHTSSVGRLFDALASLLDICQINDYEGEAPILLEYAAFQELQTITTDRLPVNEEAETKYDKNSKKESLEKTIAKKSEELPLLVCHYPVYTDSKFILWEKTLIELLKEIPKGRSAQTISLQFHLYLIEVIISVLNEHSLKSLIVSGGVFQNRLLLELLQQRCEKEEIKLIFPSKVPINDGGISLGQLIYVLKQIQFNETIC